MIGERKPIGQILKEQGLVTDEQLAKAAEVQQQQGGAFGQILVELGYVTEEQILNALGRQAGMEVVDLRKMEIPPEVIEKVSPTIANMYRVVPVKYENGVLTVAMADPLNINILDDLRALLNCEVVGAVSNEEAVSEAIAKYYSSETESIEDIISELDDVSMDVVDMDSDNIDIQSLEQMASQAPVVKLLNLVLLSAIKDHASDIHFEPFEDEFKIRYRVDGVLYEMLPPPKHLALAITSRIKVMANMDIAERRVPQDSRIMLNVGGRPVDLRVSTLPTMFGESVVMRVLDRSVVNLDLDKIGFRPEELDLFRRYIRLPHGIILVTGPTGSGKTTTLYAALSEVNTVDTKIITTEDPVEYDIDGIIQVNINEEIGLTYARCLRAILRQDPDKILVGEIRDLETAQIAIEASLTGHIVFSTLHTNDAPSTIIRLVDMGLEPFLVAATLRLVVAQRLVRTICPKCKTAYEPSDEELMALGLTRDQVKGKQFFYGKGCEECKNTGYKGRTAIFEMMEVSERIAESIIEGKSTEEIRAIAIEEGMRTLREAGIMKIFDGQTTIEEVVRETLAFEE